MNINYLAVLFQEEAPVQFKNAICDDGHAENSDNEYSRNNG